MSSISSGVGAVEPGAEPFSADGGPVGVLVLHGFTGSPRTGVGTLDNDASEIFDGTLAFVRRHSRSQVQ